MPPPKLRAWYERQLGRAMQKEIVQSFTDVQTSIEHLTSIREFPMFDGDFFPEQLQQLIMQQPAEELSRRGALPPGEPSASAAPGLHKQTSFALVEQIKKQARAPPRRASRASRRTARPSAAAPDASACARAVAGAPSPQALPGGGAQPCALAGRLDAVGAG